MQLLVRCNSIAYIGAMLNKSFKRPFGKLFHQQCWCWGVDIRNAHTNYLVEYGFRYTPRKQAGAGSSRYSLELGTHTLHLWAFGAVLTDEQGDGISLKRYDQLPKKLIPGFCAERITEAADFNNISHTAAPSALGELLPLLHIFIKQIVAYETYIQQLAPSSYRNNAVNGWKHKYVHGTSMVKAWSDLLPHLRKPRSGRPAA